MNRDSKESATLEPTELDEHFDPFWSERSLDQLAAEQQVAAIVHLEEVWGKGKSLWLDDEDFEAFLAATEGAASEKVQP
jgi:hypothetical protein